MRHRLPYRSLIVLVGLALGGFALLSYADPAIVPQAVDIARGIVGVEAVSTVEQWVFQLQDTMRQADYHATGARVTAQWAATAQVLPEPAPAVPAAPAPAAPPALTPTSVLAAAPAAPAPAVSDGLIWEPYVSSPVGTPILTRALVSPDPARPYVQAALVRIDLRQVRLHLVAGTDEPKSPVRSGRSGLIPSGDRRAGLLLAAFNGGFKAAHGAYGMAVGKVTYLPPQDGLATLVIDQGGGVRIGVWGQDLGPSPEIAAFRQNCPLVVDGGALTTMTQSDDATLWGKSIGNKVATWRTGVGLSADGRYLIYVAGDGLTVPTLGTALIMGGVSRGMQLDINSFWARFVTFAPAAGKQLRATKLLSGMQGDLQQFLAADSRDFFYVTAR
jgi:hypothetical protein